MAGHPLLHMKQWSETHSDHLRGSLHVDKPLQFAVGDDKLLWAGYVPSESLLCQMGKCVGMSRLCLLCTRDP